MTKFIVLNLHFLNCLYAIMCLHFSYAISFNLKIKFHLIEKDCKVSEKRLMELYEIWLFKIWENNL